MDAHPSRYSANVRVQSHREQVILDLTPMVRNLLIEFYKATRYKPVRIIMYRNGVSENQLGTVSWWTSCGLVKSCSCSGSRVVVNLHLVIQTFPNLIRSQLTPFGFGWFSLSGLL